ncbi:uncharacterized protein PG986_005068 [Apiospora aurea]|uniref:Uncharacterized protein n=1 Tax=Apiospora aurea TaxID=335848 RepID=A0ABR1QGH3_9PEZI
MAGDRGPPRRRGPFVALAPGEYANWSEINVASALSAFRPIPDQLKIAFVILGKPTFWLERKKSQTPISTVDDPGMLNSRRTLEECRRKYHNMSAPMKLTQGSITVIFQALHRNQQNLNLKYTVAEENTAVLGTQLASWNQRSGANH